MIVEDDSVTRDLLKTLLQRNGAEVAESDSCESAVKQLRHFRPDVLISDIGMPGENGYELIRQIGSLSPEEGGRVPGIAVTAYDSASDRRRALLAGFQAHLPKPIDEQDLVTVIKSLTFQAESGNM